MEHLLHTTRVQKRNAELKEKEEKSRKTLTDATNKVTEINSKIETLIKEFGMKPGPQLGSLLKKIEIAIVEGSLANQKADILAFVAKEKVNE